MQSSRAFDLLQVDGRPGLEQTLDACQVTILRCQHHRRDTVAATRVDWNALLSEQSVGARDCAMLAGDVQDVVARLSGG